jgi:hypothetical protein
MEQQNVTPTASQSAAPVTPKLPYEPPKATFVPLKMEERLSFFGSKCDPTVCTAGSYIQIALGPVGVGAGESAREGMV